ncbi:MAG TPA: tRNA pseudouridine(55) synthase TruB [Pyrinomonadaceae bacterium]|nr:tRNA pseudouridine(55) synthase TruB [Pyrinomonadaceae bacterium]
MNGALIVDKPAGLTSHDVVARVRHLLQERRVGHTGTLDPFATGVLVLLIGRATRLAQFLSGLQKEYEAVIRLGFATDTGDITGKPLINAEALSADVAGSKVKFGESEIEAALAGLRGDIDQVPPMYSAKKQQGRKLYELARRGEEVERQPVRVTIQRFETNRAKGGLLKDNLDGTYDLDVLVACSSGTYVRTLAEDFGKRLGIGAHVAELRRTRVGAFQIAHAITLVQLQESIAEESLGRVLLAPDTALAHLPAIDLSADEVRKVRNGVNVEAQESMWIDGEPVRLRDDHGHLVAVGLFEAEKKTLRPRVVLAHDES